MNNNRNKIIKKRIDVFSLSNYPVRIIVFLISIITSFYIAYNTDYPGYENLFLLPLIYGCLFVFLIAPVLFKSTNIFLIVISIYTFTRYVIIPFLIVYTGLYGGRSPVPPLPTSYSLALNLMIYEIIAVSIVLFFAFKNVKRNIGTENEVKLPKTIFFYIVFVFLSLVMLVISPGAINSFAFLMPSETTGGIATGSTLQNITFYSLLTTKYLIFLILMSFFYKKYQATDNNIYVIFAFITVLLNIAIIFGDNRADFIVSAIVSIILFYKLFPKQARFASLILIILIFIITGFISEHRNNQTLTGGADELVDFTHTLQVYMGGPYNVALAVETAELNPDSRTLFNFSYDMLRPAIGFNFLLRGLDVKMSNEHFNERYFYSDRYSQIIPMIGQGYFYFGFFGAPIIIIIFILLARFILSIIQKQSRIELIFFLSIPLTRFGLAMGQNGGILINDATFFLVLNLAVYYVNNKISLR